MARARELGGQVIPMGPEQAEIMSVSDFGTMALITDPTGASFGL